ncbi:MAG: Kelch repeat-containing protein [Candidatus Saccharimonadales bacterium]
MKQIYKHLRKTGFLSAIIVFATLLITPSVLAVSPGSLGSWTTSSNTLPQAVQGAASVTYNGYVYVIGGTNTSGSYLNTTYYAKLNSDGTVSSWSTSSYALPQLLSGVTAVTYNGYIYVAGGYTGSVYTQAVYYAKINSDGSINSWSSGTVLPSVLDNATSVVNNGYIYVLGGYSGIEHNSVYYAKLNSDGSVGSWVTSANNLPQGLDTAASVVNNSYVYVMGGENGGSTLNTIYIASLNSDGSVGSWNTNSVNLPEELWGEDAVTNNGYVYILGGIGTSGDVNTVYYSTFNSNNMIASWTASPNTLPQILDSATAVTYNNYVYVMGGENTRVPQYTVYYAYLTPNFTTINPTAALNTPAAPNTGYGKPYSFNQTILITIVASSIAIGSGLVLVYRQRCN